MKIGDKEVDDMLLMSYSQTIRNIGMVSRLGKFELIEVLDRKRQDIHDAILASVGEDRGSEFETALFNYRDKLYREMVDSG